MADKTLTDNRQSPYESLGIERRAKEQVERYRERGLDIDDFEFMPFEDGTVFHADDQTPPNRFQAWLQKNDAGEWDVVYLDQDSVRNVYERQALPVLEAERQADLRPETDGTLSWYPNRSATDNREVPDIQSFWMLKDNDGQIWGCDNEHLQLIGPDGQVIEAQDDMYPPHVFDLETGRLATGFGLRINPDNPPENMPAGLTDANGMVNQMAADMFLGFKTPNPSEPGAFVRFKPAEEGFVIGYVQSNGQDPALVDAANAVAEAAVFTPDGMEFISVPDEHLTLARVEPRVVPEVSAPDYSRVNEAMAAPAAVEPAAGVAEETEAAPVYDREAHESALDDFRNMVRDRHEEQAAEAVEREAYKAELNEYNAGAAPVETVVGEPDYSRVNESLGVGAEVETPSAPVEPPSESDLVIERLNMYLDIAEPAGADTMRSLLNGDFGEPSALDIAFVAESLYAHVLQNSNDNDNFAPAMMQVYSDLRLELPELREAAGYVPHGQVDTIIFEGKPSDYPGLGEPVYVTHSGDVYTYSQTILDAAPGIMPVGEMVDYTTLGNNPDVANALKAELGVEVSEAPVMPGPTVSVPENAAGTQLEAYIDIIKPEDAEALKALIDGKFGEPSAMDMAFVAESIYSHIVNQTSDAGYQGSPDQLQVLENLKAELPELRDAAGYSASDFNNGVVTPHGLGDNAPLAIAGNNLIGGTSFMNDSDFSAKFTAHKEYTDHVRQSALDGNKIPGSEINMDLIRQPDFPVKSSGGFVAPAPAPIELDETRLQSAPDASESVFQISYSSYPVDHVDMNAKFDKDQYYEFTEQLIGDILESEGGREAIIAGFMEMNDPNVFPFKPVLEDNGTDVVTMNLNGDVVSLWEDLDGNRIPLTAEHLGALIDQAVNVKLSGLDAYLAANPEMEVVFQMMAVTLDEIQQIEVGALEADVNAKGTYTQDMSPEEFNNVVGYLSPAQP